MVESRQVYAAWPLKDSRFRVVSVRRAERM